MNNKQLQYDVPPDAVECCATPDGVYGWVYALVVDDEVTVQCRKYDYDNVKHLLRGFRPVDNDLLRPIFTKTFDDSPAARRWWNTNGPTFLAGTATFSDDGQIVVYGQTLGAMNQFAAWIQYLQDHPDHAGTAAIYTNPDGTVEVVGSQYRSDDDPGGI